MKVKVVGFNHYVRTVNDKEYDNYKVFFVRRPYKSVFSESDIQGFVCDSVRGGSVFKGIQVDKCYDFTEAQTRVFDGKPVYEVVEIKEIDKI